MLNWRSCAGLAWISAWLRLSGAVCRHSHDQLLLALRAESNVRGLTFPEDFETQHAIEVERRFAAELAAVPGLIPLLEAHSGPRAVASSSNPEPLAKS